jgi:hypothetical protein
VIRWSQPEIVLYDDDPFVRMSYPDLIEDGGRYYLTETQKDVARVHELDTELLKGLWDQFGDRFSAARGAVLRLPEPGAAVPSEAAMPALPPFLERDEARSDYGMRDLRAGFTVELWLRLNSLAPGQVVVDTRTPGGRGMCLRTTASRTLEIVVNDGRTESCWASDQGAVREGRLHHVIVNVDGGPKIILFVVDGQLNDGGDTRQFGWGRFSPHLRDANGGRTLRIGPSLDGEVRALRVYGRCLTTSESIANYRAGWDAASK